ncbi:MAG: tetratricopeptide repeat protein [Thermoguttaceae bacterium]
MNKDPIRSPHLLDFYEKYLDNQDSAVFINLVGLRYSPGTLQRLAKHPFREVRRAAILALGFLGDYGCNHTMGRALQDDDRTVRTLAENGIRSIWARDGSEKDRRELDVLFRLNAAQQFKDVIPLAGKLIERAPWFAEAWYQRALSHYALGRLADAIRDCHEALEINPYHFIAATTMGQAYLELENPVSALDCFRRALRLNPDLEVVRNHVVRLARLVEDK